MRTSFPVKQLVRLSWTIVFVLFLLLTVSAVFRKSSPAESNGSRPVSSDWLARDRDLAVYLEALEQINQQAWFLKNPLPRGQLIRDTLRSYLAKLDAHSNLLSVEESERLQQLQSGRYRGIGMDLERSPEGAILCFPQAKTSAEKAGIRTGDELVAVNGTSVRGLSLTEISTMTSNSDKTQIELGIKRNGKLYHFNVALADTSLIPVVKVQTGAFTVFTLAAFTAHTRSALQTLLTGGDDDPIILDLRMNRGGDFNAAVDTAKLFLHAGNTVVSIRSRTGVKDYIADQDGPYLSNRIYLWQDEHTASAAEVFIAALTGNRRAESIGFRTAGKGTKQDLIGLSDGSFLLLTTGYLMTPKGGGYDKRGLDPVHKLDDKSHDTEPYLRKLEELIYWND